MTSMQANRKGHTPQRYGSGQDACTWPVTYAYESVNIFSEGKIFDSVC